MIFMYYNYKKKNMLIFLREWVRDSRDEIKSIWNVLFKLRFF